MRKVTFLGNFVDPLMKPKNQRKIFFYENYFQEFYDPLSKPVKEKIVWTLNLLIVLDKVPIHYFKHITGSSGLYEIRIEWGSNIYRIFSFFDRGDLIVVTNGFQKKSQKTPRREIELAEQLKKKYFHEKEKT